jgi:hypothetical protein
MVGRNLIVYSFIVLLSIGCGLDKKSCKDLTYVEEDRQMCEISIMGVIIMGEQDKDEYLGRMLWASQYFCSEFKKNKVDCDSLPL